MLGPGWAILSHVLGHVDPFFHLCWTDVWPILGQIGTLIDPCSPLPPDLGPPRRTEQSNIWRDFLRFLCFSLFFHNITIFPFRRPTAAPCPKLGPDKRPISPR